MKKAFLVLALTLTAAAAQAATTHAGIVTEKGVDSICSFTNTTDHELDLEYVMFNVQDVTGENGPRDIVEDFDHDVNPGETVSATLSAQSVAVKVLACSFVSE